MDATEARKSAFSAPPDTVEQIVERMLRSVKIMADAGHFTSRDIRTRTKHISHRIIERLNDLGFKAHCNDMLSDSEIYTISWEIDDNYLDPSIDVVI